VESHHSTAVTVVSTIHPHKNLIKLSLSWPIPRIGVQVEPVDTPEAIFQQVVALQLQVLSILTLFRLKFMNNNRLFQNILTKRGDI